MTHGDDKGLVLPPRVAPTQVMYSLYRYPATSDARCSRTRAFWCLSFADNRPCRGSASVGLVDNACVLGKQWCCLAHV